jgi:ubiquitin fusion degradation protein 1
MFSFFSSEPAPPRYPQTFSQEYQAFPSSFSDRSDIDRGDKIILPQSALNILSRLHIQYPMLFKLTNEAVGGIEVHCGVLEFVAEEGTVILPTWLFDFLCLEAGGYLQVDSVSLVKGTFVKLQPFTSDFLEISNPKAVLENTLRHFSTLTEGERIKIDFAGKKYEIEIKETRPAKAVTIIEADIEVDFEAPKDYVEPPRMPVPPVPAANLPGPPANQSGLFSGGAVRLDGKAPKPHQFMPSEPVKNTYDLEPWLKRIPGGVKTVPPYGFKK